MKRVICEICTADLGRAAGDDMYRLFLTHCAASHPAEYARIAEAYHAAKRCLPTEGLHL